MTFEPDTGLLVNTGTGVVHKPDCEVVTRTNQRSGRWLAPWKGVAISDSDKPCGYCKPDLDAARAVVTAPEGAEHQPPGFPGHGDSWLPPAEEAARRVLAFVASYGDGRIDDDVLDPPRPHDPPLYARDLEAVAKYLTERVGYNAGYQDGESSGYADFNMALDDVWPEDRGDPYPSKVADYIGELQQSIERVTRFAEEHLGTANTGSIQRVLRGEAPFL
jgi:hypothetical protein